MRRHEPTSRVYAPVPAVNAQLNSEKNQPRVALRIWVKMSGLCGARGTVPFSLARKSGQSPPCGFSSRAASAGLNVSELMAEKTVDTAIAGDIGHRNQAEIGGAAADVAHQDDVARRHRVAPLPAGSRRPGIECRLWFLQQRYVAQSGGLGRFGRQVSRDLVERSGHRHHDLAVSGVPLPALGLSGVEEGVLEVL